MSKYTPGPWRWSDEHQARDLSDTWSLIGSDGYGILSCDGKCNSPNELNRADASLIAAAPELLEALEELSLLMDDVRNGEYTPDHLTTQPARAAIAKAKGEE